MENLREKFEKANTSDTPTDIFDDLEKIADEHAIEFSDWKDRECMRGVDGWDIRIPLGSRYSQTYNNTELLAIYKKETE